MVHHYYCFSRIKTFLPEAKKAYHQGGEPVATKLDREKLESLEQEQQVSARGYKVLDYYFVHRLSR